MNPNKKASSQISHVNFMGGESFTPLDPLMRLHMVCASAMFGENKYYKPEVKPGTFPQDRSQYGVTWACMAFLNDIDPKYAPLRKLHPSAMIEYAIDDALSHDPEATLAYAHWLRKAGNLRTTPQVILARAANHKALKGTGLIRRYAPQVCQRIDDTTTCLAYYIYTYGPRSLPNNLKKGIAERLRRANAYGLAKYRDDDKTVKLKDVVKLTTGDGYGSKGWKNYPAVKELLEGTLKLVGDGKETWESVRSAKRPWKDAIPLMQHMALLRNLRNLEKDNALEDWVLANLVSGVAEGQQLPFRYFTAYQQVSQANTKQALEDCMELSLDNLRRLGGNTLSLCDYSGSAQSAGPSDMSVVRVCDIGGLLATMIHKLSDNGVIGMFGDSLIPHVPTGSMLKEMETIGAKGRGVGESTEHGVWVGIQQAIDKKTHFDRICIFSDMQAGHGGLYGKGGYPNFEIKLSDSGWGNAHINIPKLFNEYRMRVNPNCRLYCIQIAGYEDAVAPSNYDHVTIMSGWSDKIPMFMWQVENGSSSSVKKMIEEYYL